MNDPKLIDWAVRVAEFMSSDKSNDWSEELDELDSILGFD